MINNVINTIINNFFKKIIIQPIIFFVVYFLAIAVFFAIMIIFAINGNNMYDFIFLICKINKVLLIVGWGLLALSIVLLDCFNKKVCKILGYIFLVISALMLGFRNYSNNMINVEELDIENYKGKYTNIDDNFYLNYEDSDCLINVAKIKTNESAKLTIGNIEYYNKSESLHLIYNSNFDINKYERYLTENNYICTKESTEDGQYSVCTNNNLTIVITSDGDRYFVIYETK